MVEVADLRASIAINLEAAAIASLSKKMDAALRWLEEVLAQMGSAPAPDAVCCRGTGSFVNFVRGTGGQRHCIGHLASRPNSIDHLHLSVLGSALVVKPTIGIPWYDPSVRDTCLVPVRKEEGGLLLEFPCVPTRTHTM